MRTKFNYGIQVQTSDGRILHELSQVIVSHLEEGFALLLIPRPPLSVPYDNFRAAIKKMQAFEALLNEMDLSEVKNV